MYEKEKDICCVYFYSLCVVETTTIKNNKIKETKIKKIYKKVKQKLRALFSVLSFSLSHGCYSVTFIHLFLEFIFLCVSYRARKDDS